MSEKTPEKSEPEEPDNAEREKPEPPPRKHGRRLFFNLAPIWPALTDERCSDAARDLLDEAIDTAMGRNRRPCFVCLLPWAIDRSPFAVLLVQPTGGEPGAMAMICDRCVTWRWDDALLAAIHRDFGLSPSELSVVHSSARAD